MIRQIGHHNAGFARLLIAVAPRYSQRNASIGAMLDARRARASSPARIERAIYAVAHLNHSSRNDCIGSTRDARIAGSSAANAATTVTTTTTPDNVTGSEGVTP